MYGAFPIIPGCCIFESFSTLLTEINKNTQKMDLGYWAILGRKRTSLFRHIQGENTSKFCGYWKYSYIIKTLYFRPSKYW